jgi:hypothetical protein
VPKIPEQLHVALASRPATADLNFEKKRGNVEVQIRWFAVTSWRTAMIRKINPFGTVRKNLGSTSYEHLFVAGLERRPDFFDLSMHSLRSAVGLPELKERSPTVGDEKASEILPSWSLKPIVQRTP